MTGTSIKTLTVEEAKRRLNYNPCSIKNIDSKKFQNIRELRSNFLFTVVNDSFENSLMIKKTSSISPVRFE